MRSWPLAILVNIACTPPATVAHRQPEREANRILLALARDGVEARKTNEAGERFAVTVPAARRDEALLVLERAGLPRPPRTRTADLLQNAPLVPTPSWERTQRTVGLEGDLVAALRSWPGVVDAEALLGLPPDGSGVAVLVVHAPERRLDVDALQRFVQAKLPLELTPRIELVPQPEAAPLPAPSPNAAGRWAGAGPAAGGLIAVLAGFGALALRWRRRLAS